VDAVRHLRQAWAGADGVRVRLQRGCYLFSDKNAQGYAAAIDRDLLDVVADFVFHKTVLAHSTNWEQLSKAENAENGDSSPEKPAGSKAGFRSVRFLSFGISRIAFPEETIREALTFEFERQALNQLAFNNWQDGIGYLERPKQRADADFVASPQQRQEWRLTDEHLRLQRPIIDSDATRKWQDFHEEWEGWETHYVSLAQMTDWPRWLNELKTLFQSAWASGFRGGGVQQFFESAQRDRRALAAAIRDRVEASLFDDWRNGVRAMYDCSRAIAALIEDIEARNGKMANFVQGRDNGAADLDRQFVEIERNWSKWRVMPGSRPREITKAALLLREQHCSQTLAFCGRFARALCDELVTQFNALKREVDKAATNLTDAAEKAGAQIKARSAALANETDGGEAINYVGDTGQLELARRKLVLNEEEQRTHTAAVRQRIIGKLEGQATFAKLADGLGGADIANAILSTSAENMASAHQRLLTDRKERVIGVSVIEKLVEQWGDSQERLDREAAHLARSAGRFLVFDETEERKGFPGRTDHKRALQSIGVLLPHAADHREFLAKLTKAFENAHLGGSIQEIGSPRQDQIALVTITNLFPLRFVGLVKDLKTRYEQRIARAGRARATLEIHIEGDGTQFSDLFIPEGADIARSSRAPLLIAVATGALEREPAGSGGRGPMVLRRKNDHGFEIEPIRLGADLAEAAGRMTEAQLYTLQEAVDPLAKSLRGQTEDALAAARKRMLAEIEILRASRNVGPTDPDILAWNQAGTEAMRMIQVAV
jgi:hypothetical protein